MNVMPRYFLAAVLGVCFLADAAHAQKSTKRSASSECQTELKATDGYRELSAALKCLDDRIKALEASRAPASPGAPRAAVDVAPPASERAQVLLNKTLQVEIKQCGWAPSGGNLYCSMTMTNLTKEDKKVCLGAGSRLVTDKGSSFSVSGGMDANVGSVTSSISNSRGTVCDDLPPLSKIEAWVRFWNSARQADGEVQFLRIDCGPGCVYETYKIPIK